MADIPPPPPPSGAPPPPGSPGYMPQPIGPTSGSSLGMQIVGARSSIILGVIGVVVPVVWAMISGGSTFYFYVLPIFGVVYGIRAMTRGFPIGGGIGVVLNLLAGLISLTAAGIINPG